MEEKKVAERNSIFQRKNPWPKRLIILLLSLILTGVIFCSIFFPVKAYLAKKITINSIKTAWDEFNYEDVYSLSKEYLEKNPYNETALTYYSYSCFFLSFAQEDNQKSIELLDDCINNLRIILFNASDDLKPQIYYMLGRSYFYKNTISAYYSDLAVKYLQLAKDNNYVADDLSEYLGLSYAALGMIKESISAFTEALLIRESDSLLLSIAEQYYKIKEYGASKQYLFRIIQDCKNDELVIKAMNLLASIYFDEENYSDALQTYNDILVKLPDSADANYGIGLVYEKQGNTVKARAQWRNTLKIQPNHAGALQKMSKY